MLAKIKVPENAQVRLVAARTGAARGDGKEKWDSDSGASFHMSHTQAGMTAYKKTPTGTITEVADGTILPVDGFETVEVGLNQPGTTTKPVKMVFVGVPGLSRNLMSTRKAGACHYLTNLFQMKAPVAPSRSLQEGSMKPPWVWLTPSRSLREAFSKPSRSLQRPRRLHEALVKTSRTLRGGATASPLRECFMKAP